MLMKCSFLMLCLIVSGCAGSPRIDLPSQLAQESMAMVKSANLGSATPEARMRLAGQLLAHMKQYDPIILDPYAANRDQLAALRFKRAEADMAAMITNKQAQEYIEAGKLDRGRDMYYLIIKTFSSDAYNGIRRNAEAELKQLDEKEKTERPVVRISQATAAHIAQ